MEYSGTAEEGHRISTQVAVGWLGNERITDPLWKNMLQNVAEFYCVEAEIHGYTHQFYDEDPAKLCEKAKKAGCSHVLILKVGIFPRQLFDSFTEWFENYYKGEVFVGHVLDKGDLYYEIHPQCMLVDVNWFCEHVGIFEQRFRNKLVDFVQPSRSIENFHDHYTPLWVKQGEVVRTYEGTCWGWNIVEAGLQTETGIGIWPKEIRKTYHYAYGEVKQDYIGKKAQIIGNLQNKEQFFIANTEDYTLPKQPPEVDPNIKRVIFAMSGGLSGPFLAYNNCGKNTNNQKVIVIDRSEVALGISNYIFKGFKPNTQTYKKFMQQYFGQGFLFMRKLVQGAHRLDDFSDYIEYHDGFKDYFENEWQGMTIDFEHIELFDADNFKRLFRSHVIKDIDEDAKYEVYIHFSNVFHFYQSAVFFNLAERNEAKTNLENYFKEITGKYSNIKLFIVGPGGVFEFENYLPWSAEGHQLAKEIFPWIT